MTMNQYGTQLLRHWQRHRAEELATIPDPQAHFAQLGELAAAEIERRASLLEPAMLSEDFLANVGALNGARQTAENEVLRELLEIPS